MYERVALTYSIIYFMKKPIAFILLFCLLCGCNSMSTQSSSGNSNPEKDSLSLKVALMPTLDCLPFYYADRCGVFRNLGLDIQLHTFKAQMDCDTAFARGHTDVSYTDLIRAALLQSKGIGVHVIQQADGHHTLSATTSKNTVRISDLKERTVGMARHSVTDLLLDTVIATAGLDAATVYHPQINDIVLRYDMLHNTTLDAAFLPEPYATQSRLDSNNIIYDSRKHDIRLMAFMASDKAVKDSLKKEQINLLIQGYNLAIEKINAQENKDSIRSILLRYPIKPNTIDSLKLPIYKPAEVPNPKDIKTALRFLNYRNLIKSDYSGDTLISIQFIP